MSRNNNRNASRPQSPASQAHKAQPAEVKTSAASDPLKGLNLTKEGVQKNILHHLHSTLGTSEQKASDLAWWEATCASINELVFERLTQTQQTHFRNDTRAVHYFSAEFLMGRLTQNNLINLHLFDVYDEALKASGKSLSDLCELEPDMALGNGGLGRLAACFIDSLATLNFPAIGYGIHYENGLFRQEIKDGRQVERPDSWREYGNPWEICRPESVQNIPLGGYVETVFDKEGNLKKIWHPSQVIKGVPWDIPIVGYNGETVNILRLWESRASEFFDWDAFNAGSYVDAQAEQARAEVISHVLYPNDSTEAGKTLRLVQQYFFCACSVRDILRRYKRAHGNDFSEFADKIAIQLNDTHPTIAIPELMRIFIDEEGLEWDKAWDICYRVFSYTNHTLLPEALERWPVYLFERVLPRHLEIIYEINRRFLENTVDRKWPGDNAIKAKLSLIEEGQVKKVRMGNLCVVGSHKVNGVAEIHSKLVKEDLFPEYAKIWPEKFCNVTNGVTPRRWLLSCNRELAALYTKTVGENWPRDLNLTRGAVKFADDPEFQKEFMDIKRRNKEKLVKIIKVETGVDVSADAIFDVQIKRLHEYKRQQLNLLWAIRMYQAIKAGSKPERPVTVIFGAKAAPAYIIAKDIIHAILTLSEVVARDPEVSPYLRIVMIENYNITAAEKLIPACDISEQISLASKEASGTGNMKFMLNGGVTLGTMDGANVEIAGLAGPDNIYTFGDASDVVIERYRRGDYRSIEYYQKDPVLKKAVDFLTGPDMQAAGDPRCLKRLSDELLHKDWFMTFPDYTDYCETKERMLQDTQDKKAWAKKTLINIAKAGFFSSDRTIRQYNDEIWHLTPDK